MCGARYRPRVLHRRLPLPPGALLPLAISKRRRRRRHSLFMPLSFCLSNFSFFFVTSPGALNERPPPTDAGGQVIPGAGKEVCAILNVASLHGRHLGRTPPSACMPTNRRRLFFFLFRSVVCFAVRAVCTRAVCFLNGSKC